MGFTRKVKFSDRIRALELLGKHKRLFVERVEVKLPRSFAEQLKEARRRASDR